MSNFRKYMLDIQILHYIPLTSSSVNQDVSQFYVPDRHTKVHVLAY